MSAARSDLRLLASQLQGRVILPGEADYDAARRVWNGMIDKHPGAIARCVSASDVAAALQALLEAVLGGHPLYLYLRL